MRLSYVQSVEFPQEFHKKILGLHTAIAFGQLQGDTFQRSWPDARFLLKTSRGNRNFYRDSKQGIQQRFLTRKQGYVRYMDTCHMCVYIHICTRRTGRSPSLERLSSP